MNIHTVTAVIILVAEGLFALWLLEYAGTLKSTAAFFLSLVLLGGAFYLRYLCLDYKTLDYINFLSKWVDHFSDNKGFLAFSESMSGCNYNIPYLYFLALFSYFRVSDLYLIKLLSVFFDVVLAYSAMQLVGKVNDRVWAKLMCFFTVLYLPTVILNGALWAQCDSIYVALAVLSIYLALDDRPVLSMICITLSFGFKLQAVFIMPILMVLYFRGKLTLPHFLLFPVTYLILILPAVLLGRPLKETITLYVDQAGTVGSGMNYNSPSVFSLIRDMPSEKMASATGIIAAFALMFIVLMICYMMRRDLTDKAVIAAAAVLAIGIPFLLPHMHDRYFFAADIFSLILAFSYLPAAPAAPMVQYASLLGYHAFLKQRYLLPMSCGGKALVGALVISFAVFLGELWKSNPPQFEKNNWETCENELDNLG